MDLDLNITFGAIAPFMSDPKIEEIWINSPERIFLARNGRSELTNLRDLQVRQLFPAHVF